MPNPPLYRSDASTARRVRPGELPCAIGVLLDGELMPVGIACGAGRLDSPRPDPVQWDGPATSPACAKIRGLTAAPERRGGLPDRPVPGTSRGPSERWHRPWQ